MKKCEVIGFDYKDISEFEKELGISINFDMGCVHLSPSYEEDDDDYEDDDEYDEEEYDDDYDDDDDEYDEEEYDDDYDDEDYDYDEDELESELIRHIEQKYGVKIPDKYIMFTSDTDQYFYELGVGFGIMYEKEE